MPKIGKAARGKHRWIGLKFDERFSTVEMLKLEIQKETGLSKLKFLDFSNRQNNFFCIVKVQLEDYKIFREKLEQSNCGVLSITSSGKIRLVRLRLEKYFQRQIDD